MIQWVYNHQLSAIKSTIMNLNHYNSKSIYFPIHLWWEMHGKTDFKWKSHRCSRISQYTNARDFRRLFTLFTIKLRSNHLEYKGLMMIHHCCILLMNGSLLQCHLLSLYIVVKLYHIDRHAKKNRQKTSFTKKKLVLSWSCCGLQ